MQRGKRKRPWKGRSMQYLAYIPKFAMRRAADAREENADKVPVQDAVEGSPEENAEASVPHIDATEDDNEAAAEVLQGNDVEVQLRKVLNRYHCYWPFWYRTKTSCNKSSPS
jgi:hypothetical protein